LFYTFDRTGAQAMGLPVELINLGFMAAVTLTIIASMQVAGVILVIALLVGPALTAYLLTQELHQMMIVGSLLGVTASVTGVYLSYYNNLPSGPAIVLVSSLFFLLTLFLSPSQGILTRPSEYGTSAKILRVLGLIK
jgi:manganese/iron transport system permease protein